jgi:hypothetical protein
VNRRKLKKNGSTAYVSGVDSASSSTPNWSMLLYGLRQRSPSSSNFWPPPLSAWLQKWLSTGAPAPLRLSSFVSSLQTVRNSLRCAHYVFVKPGADLPPTGFAGQGSRVDCGHPGPCQRRRSATFRPQLVRIQQGRSDGGGQGPWERAPPRCR